MQNPQVRAALTNPRVIQAVQQIQAGIQTLQTEAPQLMPMYVNYFLLVCTATIDKS